MMADSFPDKLYVIYDTFRADGTTHTWAMIAIWAALVIYVALFPIILATKLFRFLITK
jgi:hypothetical protein